MIIHRRTNYSKILENKLRQTAWLERRRLNLKLESYGDLSQSRAHTTVRRNELNRRRGNLYGREESEER